MHIDDLPSSLEHGTIHRDNARTILLSIPIGISTTVARFFYCCYQDATSPDLSLLLQVPALLSKCPQSFCRMYSIVECCPVPDRIVDNVIQLPY